jgi:DNA repair protein RecN (Recombination protein N)
MKSTRASAAVWAWWSGKTMESLTQHQVFCVTHLPQLAVFGDQHYQVQKLVDKGRTLTRVEPLEGEPRLLELSQMLGEVGEGTLRSAHELLQTARQMVKARKRK